MAPGPWQNTVGEPSILWLKIIANIHIGSRQCGIIVKNELHVLYNFVPNWKSHRIHYFGEQSQQG